MSSVGPARLTDELWLAAHDRFSGKPVIGEGPLGVGLAAGLLAELIHYGFLELCDGDLFRTTPELPSDLALRPLLAKMAEEEQQLPPIAPVQGRVSEGQSGSAPASGGGRGWMEPERHSWHPAAREAWGSAPVQASNRHRRRGHDLRDWIAFLARERRAEDRVIDRLSRAGLVTRQEHRRLLGGPRVRWVPLDTTVAGAPAIAIITALDRGLPLDDTQLLLAGLFLATTLDQHALATLGPDDLARLADQLKRRLDPTSRELLKAADTAVADAALL